MDWRISQYLLQFSSFFYKSFGQPNIMGNHRLKLQVYVSTCHEGIMVLLENLLAWRTYQPFSIHIFPKKISHFSVNFDLRKLIKGLRQYSGKLNKIFINISYYLYTAWRNIDFTVEIWILLVTISAIIWDISPNNFHSFQYFGIKLWLNHATIIP